MGYIYQALNTISGKSYIGLTTRTIEKRWDEHVKYALNDWGCDHNTVLSKAIRKYPLDSWVVTELMECDSIQGLKQAEQIYIMLFHTFILDPECNGYNSTEGGDCCTCAVSYVPVLKVDIITGTVIKKYDNIARANSDNKCRLDSIAKTMIAFANELDEECFVLESFYKSQTHDEFMKFIYENCSNIVCQLDYDGNLINKFASASVAYKKTKVSFGNISNCCIDKRRMAGGYQWCYINDLDNRLNKPIKELCLGKPIVQYGMDGIKIKEWPNTETAAKYYGIDGSHITGCCTGHRQSCLKFQWRYASDNIEKLGSLTTKRKLMCVETGMIFETRNHAAKYYGVSFDAVEKNLKSGKGYIPYTLKYI